MQRPLCAATIAPAAERACSPASDRRGSSRRRGVQVLAQGVKCANPNVCLAKTLWAPAIDGIDLPGEPAALLAAGYVPQRLPLWSVSRRPLSDQHSSHRRRIHKPLAFAIGFNTNDSNLFVSGLTATLAFKGHHVPVPRLAYKLFLRYLVRKMPDPKATSAALLDAYPPHDHQLANHSDRLGWLLSDKALCGASRLARSFATAGATAYAYRHDHIFDSNHVCTAVPNYHDPALGPMHQDELSFVFGQPIFMDLGGVLPNCSVPGGGHFE